MASPVRKGRWDSQIRRGVDAVGRGARIRLLVGAKSAWPLQREHDAGMHLDAAGSEVVEVGWIRVVDCGGVGHRKARVDERGPGDGQDAYVVRVNNPLGLLPYWPLPASSPCCGGSMVSRRAHRGPNACYSDRLALAMLYTLAMSGLPGR